MASSIKFGTDGWRGIIADNFTFDNVRICAQAVADYLNDAGLADRGLVIGYDTRFASEDFAAVAAEVIAANGIKVHLCKNATPIPIISYAILVKRASGAIVITASHNAASWNGFKYKLENASSASPQVISQLENHISRIQTSGTIKQMPLEKALKEEIVVEFDPAPFYFKHINELVDLDRLRNSELNIVVDSMYGAGMGYFRRILDGGNIKVTEIHGERNPLFPGLQPEPIAANLGDLSANMKNCEAGVGLATDGDADRIGVVDEKGEYLTTLQVMSLLSLYLLEVCNKNGAIVKTITQSSMLYRLGDLYGVPVHETPVGFKYVAPKFLEEDAIIGGEESGGYAFRGHIPERDGILSGLLFLDFMVREQKSPSQLLEYLYSKVGPHYYERIDIEFPAADRDVITKRLFMSKPSHIENAAVTAIDTSDGFRFLLEDRNWLLIRFSGTEPIMRIYAESDSLSRVNKFLEAGRKMAGV